MLMHCFDGVLLQVLQDGDTISRLQAFFVVVTIGNPKYRADLPVAVKHLDETRNWQTLMEEDVAKLLLPYSKSAPLKNLLLANDNAIAGVVQSIRSSRRTEFGWEEELMEDFRNKARARLDGDKFYVRLRGMEDSKAKEFLSAVHSFLFLFPDFTPFLKALHLSDMWNEMNSDLRNLCFEKMKAVSSSADPGDAMEKALGDLADGLKRL